MPRVYCSYMAYVPYYMYLQVPSPGLSNKMPMPWFEGIEAMNAMRVHVDWCLFVSKKDCSTVGAYMFVC